MDNLWRNKNRIITFGLIFLALFLGIFVFGANGAKADVYDFLGFDPLASFLGNSLLMIQKMASWVVAFAAGLAQGALGYTDLQNAPIVEKGWTITRDLVNMFFVLVLLVIAFATILRIEPYGAKQILKNLIIVALLINFSLVFCGVIIDFSGVLTNFFIEDSPNKFFEDIAGQMGLPHILRTNAEGGNISGQMWYACVTTVKGVEKCAERDGQAFSSMQDCEDSNLFKYNYKSAKGYCKLKSPPSKAKKIDWGNINKDVYWEVIQSLIFSIIFTFIAAFVFGALAFFLIVRIMAIWILLILAPLAWFFWILPATSQLFQRWWSNFIKWIFFAPAAVFFIWLSVKSWTEFTKDIPFPGDKIAEGMTGVITDDMIKSGILPEVMQPTHFVQFLLACGMLIGSLIVAQSMSINGANGVISLSKKMSKGAGLGIAKWTGRRTGQFAQTHTAGPAGKLAKQLSKIPGIRQLARPLRRFSEKEKGTIKEEKKKYENYTSNNLKDELKGAVNPRARGAIGEILADRGDFSVDDNFSKENADKTFKAAKNYGNEKSILKARPDLEEDAEKRKKIITDMKKDNMEKLQKDSLTTDVKKDIVDQFKTGGKWTSTHLSKMADTNQNVFTELSKELNKPDNWNNLREDIKEYIKSAPGKAILGDMRGNQGIGTSTPV